jgi:hypothetical protein
MQGGRATTTTAKAILARAATTTASAARKQQQQQQQQRTITVARGAATTTTMATAPATTPTGDGDVDRRNFESDALPALLAALSSPRAAFVALDLEMTGLFPAGGSGGYLDAPEDRYTLLYAASAAFVPNQAGVSVWEQAAEADGQPQQQPRWTATTLNIWVTPSALPPLPSSSSDGAAVAAALPPRRVFSCDTASLRFLADHGFDFNRVVRDGVPMMPALERDARMAAVERRWGVGGSGSNGSSKVQQQAAPTDPAAPITTITADPLDAVKEGLSASDAAFVDGVVAAVEAWLALGEAAPERLPLPPTPGSFRRRLAWRTLEVRFGAGRAPPLAPSAEADEKAEAAATAAADGSDAPTPTPIWPGFWVDSAGGPEDAVELVAAGGGHGRAPSAHRLELVRAASARDATLAAQQRLEQQRRAVVSASGFLRVLEAIRDAPRALPVIVHNGSFDLGYLLAVASAGQGLPAAVASAAASGRLPAAAIPVLPPTWPGYKRLAREWFPGGVYDTKHLSRWLSKGTAAAAKQAARAAAEAAAAAEGQAGGAEPAPAAAAVPPPLFPGRLDTALGTLFAGLYGNGEGEGGGEPAVLDENGGGTGSDGGNGGSPAPRAAAEALLSAAAAAAGEASPSSLSLPSIAHAPGSWGGGKYGGLAPGEAAHEAGYDAYMTGAVFAGLVPLVRAQQVLMLAAAAQKKQREEGKEGGGKEDDDAAGEEDAADNDTTTTTIDPLAPVRSFCGRVNVSGSDMPHAALWEDAAAASADARDPAAPDRPLTLWLGPLAPAAGAGSSSAATIVSEGDVQRVAAAAGLGPGVRVYLQPAPACAALAWAGVVPGLEAPEVGAMLELSRRSDAAATGADAATPAPPATAEEAAERLWAFLRGGGGGGAGGSKAAESLQALLASASAAGELRALTYDAYARLRAQQERRADECLAAAAAEGGTGGRKRRRETADEAPPPASSSKWSSACAIM